ncbi:MAG TPA: hypothetical protein VGU64_15190 [Terriglobales bacterium]|nr:hypothetical protein [Terriglobales bacterium]
MNSDSGWYLVAVGVLALGISNSSVGDSARGFLDRAAAVADHVSARAIQAVAVAQLMSDRGDAGWAHAQSALAKAQVRMALAQARINARRAVLSEGRSNCAGIGRMHRAVVLSPQEDLDQDVDLQ